MSLPFGALGILSLHNSFSWQASSEIRSFAFILVFLAVVLLLAYLTNPSETTFRAYLTEQSFRHHLSRLDDATDDVPDSDSVIMSSQARHSIYSSTSSQERSTLPFHFANRASVSLRTPKHIFHSFGVCTIATTQGSGFSGNSDRIPAHTNSVDQDGPFVSDSWYLGAFGRWWRGGLIESWYRDAIIRSKDAEGWSSGILGFKTLDKLNECNRLPFIKSTVPPRISPRGAPPKLHNRERSSQRNGLFPRRNSTPPPLPKSVSLPMHTDHRQIEASKQPVSLHTPSLSQPTLCAADYARLELLPIAPNRSTPSAPLDHSPIIAEVLRQIAGAKTAVAELHTQVGEAHTGAAQSHTALQGEIETLREKKRNEDAGRADLKARTRTLDDARRVAEATRRDAEKRLKAARGAREGALKKVGQLSVEIELLRESMAGDRAAVAEGKAEVSAQERDVGEEINEKKREIKGVEDLIATLAARARELEDRITSEKERLKAVKERAESRKLHSFQALLAHNNSGLNDSVSWSSTYNPFDLPLDAPAERFEVTDRTHGLETKDNLEQSPRPQLSLSLGSLSNFSPKEDTVQGHTERRAKGYTIFDEDIASIAHAHPLHLRSLGRTQLQQVHVPTHTDTRSTFSRCGDSGTPNSPRLPKPPGISPLSSNFIQSGLINVFDSSDPSTVVSRSFQSEDDVIIERNWRSMRMGEETGTGGYTYSSSPVSATNAWVGYGEYEEQEEGGLFASRGREQHALHAHTGVPYRTNSDPTTYLQETSPERATESVSVPRRWFSTKEKPKKGLNPDAKVFRLPKKISEQQQVPAMTANNGVKAPRFSFDALNPTSLISTSSSSSTPTSLLRAFAPSPAEREVLQRVLGGSTNTSLERLPSLSDVGSIPSSPVPVHAALHPMASLIGHSHGRAGQSANHGFGAVLPSWLQLPLNTMRKPNISFSPWEDEDATSSEGSLQKRK